MSSKGTEKIKKNSASKAVAIRIFKNPMGRPAVCHQHGHTHGAVLPD